MEDGSTCFSRRRCSIHAHDGETTVDYNPEKTKLGDILKALHARGLDAIL